MSATLPASQVAASGLSSLWRLTIVAVLLIAPLGNDWFASASRATGIALVVLALAGHTVPPLRSATLVLAMFALPPGAVGEQGATLGALLLLAATTLALLHPRDDDQPLPTLATLAPLAMLAGFWLLVSAAEDSTAFRNVFLLSVAILLAGVGLITRPVQVRDSLRLFVTAVGVLSVAWLLTVPWMNGLVTGGWSPHEVTPGGIRPWRPLFVFTEWNPLVITNSPGFLGTQRASMIAGEPGAWALYCVAALGCAAVVFTGRGRNVAVCATTLGVLGSQSFGAAILFVAVAVVAGLLASTRGGIIPRWAFMGYLVAAVAAVPLTRFLLEQKAALNSASFTDRGLSFASGLRSGFAPDDRINLLATFAPDGLPTILTLVALAWFVAAPRNLILVAAAAWMFLCGLVLQPIQFHQAIWLTLALSVGLSRARTISRET